MGAGWFVVRTQTNRERWACENMEYQGAEVYNPLTVVRPARGRGLVRVQCLFPGYVFARTLVGQWRFLLGTYGVRGLLTVGNGSPALMPDREIAKLRAREDKEGMVVLPAMPRLRVGDRVTVRSGALAGQSGVYAGMGAQQRCKVLVEVMGRRVPVLVAEEELQEAEDRQ